MLVSLVEFLVTGRLGKLCLGLNRSVVLGILGNPTWWQGAPKLNQANSEVWEYGSLQVVFTTDDLVDTLRLCFRVKHEADFVACSEALLPLVFSDTNPSIVAEYTSFLQYLTEAEIPFHQLSDAVGKPIIHTPCATAKFSKILHYEESVRVEHPVYSPSNYLVTISTRV